MITGAVIVAIGLLAHLARGALRAHRRHRALDTVGRLGLPPGYDHRVCDHCGNPRDAYLQEFKRAHTVCGGPRSSLGGRCLTLGVRWD